MSEASWKNTKLADALLSRLTDVERAGFVLADGTIVELENKSDTPGNEFRADDAQLLEHIDNDEIVALWHTHPAGSNALSPEDWNAFLDWPGVQHIIVAAEGVRFYGVKGRGVVNLPGIIE